MTHKEIEKASVDYQMSIRPMAIGGDAFADMVYKANINPAFIAGAEWNSTHAWKDAQGEDLPEIDREVIALIQDEDDAWITKVVFAHRPPKHWDGKNILTGEVTRYTPKTYDKGEWNIPNVKFWLDLELPKIE